MNSKARNELVNRLSHDQCFKELTSNMSRGDYILSKIHSYDMFLEKIIKAVTEARGHTRKSLSKTKCFASDVELHLSEGNVDSMLESIHQALLHMPYDTSCYALKAKLYMNKAEIHFQKENYLAALWSIETAQEMLCSKDLSVEYIKFRIKCLKLLGWHKEAAIAMDEIVQQTESMSETKYLHEDLQDEMTKQLIGDVVPNDVNDSLPNYSAQYCAWKVLQQEMAYRAIGDAATKDKLNFTYFLDPRISIHHCPSEGRHFIATEDIPSQTVIFRERPISVVMEPEFFAVKCSHCQHDLDYRFYPCANCTEVLYCDAQCAGAAQSTYHQAECGIGGLLRSITFSAVHVFKMISQVGGPEKIIEIREDNKDYNIDQYLAETRQNGDNTTGTNSENVREKCINRYKMASTLANHDAKHDTHYNAYHTVVAIEIAVLLELAFGYRKDYPEHEFLLKLISMIVVDIRRVVYNVFGWHEYEKDEDCYVKAEVASCQCVIGSLANHSCMANVSWNWKDGVIWFTAKQTISAGQPVTITYGPTKDTEYYYRQLRLNHYHFACACSLCCVGAIQGNCLRCRACSGPVVFKSALNSNPHLNGRCLTCHQPYAQFNRFVREITRVKDTIKNLTSLVVIRAKEPNLCSQAIKLVDRLLNLSLGGSESIIVSIFDLSFVLEHLPLDSIYFGRLQQLVHLAIVISEALPTKITSELLNGRRIGSLRFWFYSLQRWTKQLASLDEQLLDQNEISRSCDALESFKYRYEEALKFLQPNDELPNVPIEQMINAQVAQLDLQHKQTLELFHKQ